MSSGEGKGGTAEKRQKGLLPGFLADVPALWSAARGLGIAVMSRKSKRSWGKKIRLVHEALNTDRAEAFGLVFKLHYALPDKERPRLEIFMDSEEARAGEWEVYRAHPEATPGSVANLCFSGLGEEQMFQIADTRCRVRFAALTTQEVNYPRGGKRLEPAYEFVVSLVSD